MCIFFNCDVAIRILSLKQFQTFNSTLQLSEATFLLFEFSFITFMIITNALSSVVRYIEVHIFLL